MGIISLKRIMFLLAVSFLFSCNPKGQVSMMKNVTGKAGEMVIVVNKNIWDGDVDSLFSAILTQDQIGLPQPEPIFDLLQIPNEAFTDIFKTTRNLILIKIDASTDSSKVTFGRDIYAYTQAVVSISAKNKSSLLALFKSHSDKIIGFFLNAERDRLVQSYAKYNEKQVSEQTSKQFGFTLTVPPGFTVAKATEDFMWLRYETPEISQGILIYTYPYTSDSTFTEDFLRARRNIFLKRNVPGPIPGSYMTTETMVPLLFNTFKMNGNYAAELRGQWKLENDFMGGPFVNLSILDVLQNRVVTLDGFVYAPSKDKRNFLRQVEAMLHSIKFDNQPDMDKINRQLDL
jgi:hypothetical protein